MLLPFLPPDNNIWEVVGCPSRHSKLYCQISRLGGHEAGPAHCDSRPPHHNWGIWSCWHAVQHLCVHAAPPVPALSNADKGTLNKVLSVEGYSVNNHLDHSSAEDDGSKTGDEVVSHMWDKTYSASDKEEEEEEVVDIEEVSRAGGNGRGLVKEKEDKQINKLHIKFTTNQIYK